MSVAALSLRNPLAVLALALILCLFGTVAYSSLGVAITPNVNFPSVLVTTTYPGADPETVEANVSRPIEDAIATLPNIDANGLTSSSSSNLSIVYVQFTTAANPDLVALDVQRVVNGIRGKLPNDADIPSVSKVDLNSYGVATVVLSGQVPPTQLQDLAQNLVQHRFNALPGVGGTSVQSGITREVHVTVDEDSLRARGLSIASVVGALQAQQVEVPAGTISQADHDFSVHFDSLAPQVAALGNIVVVSTPSGQVYLRDVARIEDTFKTRDTLVRVNGQPGLALLVVKLADANSIAVVDAVRQEIERITPDLPRTTRLDLVVDGSTYTARSFGTVRNALIEAVFVTGLILLLFLHTWRSTLIVLVSIPISVLSTFGLMALLHYNLNLLTMVALVVSVGILVDDSIVVLENISRHLQRGKTPWQAALDGREEIGLAALTITLVDVVVYVPIAILTTGLPAQFMVPFAVVITAATLSSLVVSFTLTPLLARLFLHSGEAKTGRSVLDRYGRHWDHGFSTLEHGYERLLRAALPRRWLVIGIGFSSFGLGVGLMIVGLVGYNFFPAGDQSEIDLTLTLPPATSIGATNTVALDVERQLRASAAVRGVYTVVGENGGNPENSSHGGSNVAQFTVLLVPPASRDQSAEALVASLRRGLDGRYPGARLRFGLPNPFGFGGFSGAPVQVQVQGPDAAVVDRLGHAVEQVVRGVPGAVDVDNSNDDVQTQLRARVDLSRAADLGVSARDAGLAVRAALDGFTSNATQFRRPGASSIPIRVLTANAGSLSRSDIARLPIAGANGLVPLGQFTTLDDAQIPTELRHVNREPALTIGAGAGDGVLVGDLQGAVQRAVAGVPLPVGYSITYTGQGQYGASAFGDLARAMAVGVLLMYALMMVLFGSVTLPLAVLVSLPLALVGALGAMALTHSAFTVFSMLGVAVLLGLVGKNAILLVDRTVQLRRAGYDRSAALQVAGPSRLRPIVMTTVSVIAALLPIASGLEEGSELLQSVALVLIGGLLTSTLLTLVFVPAMYTLFDDAQELVLAVVRRPRRAAPPDPETAEPRLPALPFASR